MNGQNQSLPTHLTISRLARLRMRQNRISRRMVAFALEYGERQRKPGCTCFRITAEVWRDRAPAGLPERLRGLCVVVTDAGEIHTVRFERLRRRPAGYTRFERPSERRGFLHRMEVDDAILAAAYPEIPEPWQVARRAA